LFFLLLSFVTVKVNDLVLNTKSRIWFLLCIIRTKLALQMTSLLCYCSQKKLYTYWLQKCENRRFTTAFIRDSEVIAHVLFTTIHPLCTIFLISALNSVHLRVNDTSFFCFSCTSDYVIVHCEAPHHCGTSIWTWAVWAAASEHHSW